MNSISGISGQSQNLIPSSNGVKGAEKDFKDTMSDYLSDVNGLIQDAGSKAKQMVNGEITDIHDVMIAGQKASIALEMVVEIRNKLIESYHEFMRMQV